MIGENENKDLEKKIFLQIIDFSWEISLTISGTIKTSNRLKTAMVKKILCQNLKRSIYTF